MGRSSTPQPIRPTNAQYRTARRFSRPSPLYRWAAEEGILDHVGAALVFGAGLLIEARDLSARGWSVDALETDDSLGHRRELYSEFAQQKGCRMVSELGSTRRRYDLIVVTHVLEFIESIADRHALANALAQRLKKDGRMLVSLRGWSDVSAAKTQTRRGDGIVTGLGTWTRGFTVAEAQEMLDAAGLVVEGSPHPRSKTPEQVRLLCRTK